MQSISSHMKAIAYEVLTISIRNMNVKITFLKLLPHLPVSNELKPIYLYPLLQVTIID